MVWHFVYPSNVTLLYSLIPMEESHTSCSCRGLCHVNICVSSLGISEFKPAVQNLCLPPLAKRGIAAINWLQPISGQFLLKLDSAKILLSGVIYLVYDLSLCKLVWRGI